MVCFETVKVMIQPSGKAWLALWALMLGCGSPAAWAFDGAAPRSGAVYAATGTVQVAFTPGDNAARLVADAIQQARRQVLVQAFSFTSRDIAFALIAAKRRGVDVQLIADPEQARRIGTSLVDEIAAAGVPVFFDREHDSAHNKVMVIDADGADAAVITGSFNFTQAAQHRNAENLLLLRGNPPLTAAYLRNWRRHREHAVPFYGR